MKAFWSFMYSSSQSTHCTVVMIASLEWEGMQYYSEFLRILQEDSGILQASTESLTPSILLGFRWSVKYIFAPNSPIFRRSPRKKEDGENHKMQSISLFKQKQKSYFCIRPWSLLTILNLSTKEPTNTSLF